jgi:hypothetical protein
MMNSFMASFPFTIYLDGKGIATARLEEKQGLLRRLLPNRPLAGVLLILFSYQRFGCDCNIQKVSGVGGVW